MHTSMSLARIEPELTAFPSRRVSHYTTGATRGKGSGRGGDVIFDDSEITDPHWVEIIDQPHWGGARGESTSST